MADLQVLINILSRGEQNVTKISRDIDGLGRSVDRTNQKVGALQSNFGKLIGFFVGAAGIRKAITEFDNLDDAQNRLSIALERNTRLGSGFSASLSEQAAQLSRVNNLTTAQVTNLQALTANLGLAEDQTIGLNNAIANLADRSGQDLETVARGVASLINTGTPGRGIGLEGINTTGFANLSTGQRASAFLSQVPVDTRNGNELRQTLVQITNLFANLGRLLNTVLGPALRVINDLLSAINRSPVLSNVVGAGILGGGLILAINALIKSIGVLTTVMSGERAGSFLSTLFGSAAGSGAGIGLFSGNASGAAARLNRRVAGRVGAFGSLFGATKDFGFSGRAAGFAGNTTSGLSEFLGASAGVSRFFGSIASSLTTLLGLVGRLSGIIGLLVIIFQGFKAGFEGLVEAIGPSNISKIKQGFGDFVDFIEELPGIFQDAFAALFIGLTSGESGDAAFDRLRREREARIKQEKDQIASGNSGDATVLPSTYDVGRTEKLRKIAFERTRLEAGFVQRSYLQGQINSLNQGSKETDRIASIRLQNELLQARISNLFEENAILGEEKSILDEIGNLNEIDLDRQRELAELRSNNLDKIIALKNEQNINLQIADEIRFNVARENRLLDQSLGMEIRRVSEKNSQLDLEEKLFALQEKIIDTDRRGGYIDDAKIQRLREIYQIQFQISQLQEKTADSERASEIANLQYQNRSQTDPRFGRAQEAYDQELKRRQERLYLANEEARVTSSAFFEGNASREDLDAAILKVEQANSAVIQLQKSSSVLSDIVGNSLVNAFDKIVDGTASAAEALRSILDGILSDLAKLFVRQASLRVATSLFGAGTTGGSGLADILSYFPTGGIVTANDGPRVSADGHRLVAVQAGELILNQAQQRSLASGMVSAAPVVHNFNLFSDNDLYRAMQRTGGQSVVINAIRSNPRATRSSL